MVPLERLLYGMQFVEIGKSFDGCDRRAIERYSEMQATASRVAVDQDRACTANALFATDMRAFQAQLMA